MTTLPDLSGVVAPQAGAMKVPIFVVQSKYATDELEYAMDGMEESTVNVALLLSSGETLDSLKTLPIEVPFKTRNCFHWFIGSWVNPHSDNLSDNNASMAGSSFGRVGGVG